MKLGTNSIAAFRRQYRQATKVALCVLFLICGFAVVYSLRHTSNTSFVKVLPQDPAVKVYFNHNQASKYEDPYRHFIRTGDNLEQQIIDVINQSQSTVDLAVMEFRLPKVAEALITKHAAGVKVRILIDNKYNKSLADYTADEIARMKHHDKSAFEELKRYPADAIAMLRASGIEIRDDTFGGGTKGSGLMHHKFMVIDGMTTIVASANLTTSDMHGDFNSLESRGNANNLVVVANKAEFGKAFTEEFNYMWQGLFKSHKPYRPPLTIPIGEGTVTVNFSPAGKKQAIEMTSNGIIAFYLKQVSSSAHIALFVYSDQKISDTLEAVHNQGVEDIKILIDPDFYRQPYSKAYDALGLCPTSSRKRSRIQVHPWQNFITTVGFPVSATGDRSVHSKMAILDGRLVITGSHNWSNSGNYLNDETLLAIDNPTVAAHYEREFSRLYGTAIVGLKSLPHAHKCNSNNLRSPTQSTTPIDLESSDD